MTGRFISFEGIDGTGKTTQIDALVETLERHGVECVKTREPGGTPYAEQLRDLLLQGAAKPFGAQSEALLFAAARIDHIEKVIKPALEGGCVVVCDRFADSTKAYQGSENGIDKEDLERLQRVVIGETMPDLTIILDLPVEKAMERIKNSFRNGTDCFEQVTQQVLSARREVFLEIAFNEPTRCVIVDADQAAETLAKSIHALVLARFEELNFSGHNAENTS